MFLSEFKSFLRILLFAFLLSPFFANAESVTDDAFRNAAKQLGASDRSAITAGIEAVLKLDDRRSLALFEAMRDERLLGNGETVVVLDSSGKAIDPANGEVFTGDVSALSKPRMNNSVRRRLKDALAALQLSASDVETRKAASIALAETDDPIIIDVMRRAMLKESEPSIRQPMILALARADLMSSDKARRIAALDTMGDSGELAFRETLLQLLGNAEDGTPREADADVRNAAVDALKQINRKQFWVNQIGNLIYGVSLGSVLLLAALGLAITFGLMGVINMAHGEMLMLGAYSTYAVQEVFRQYLPGMFDFYLIAAVPVAFAIAMAVGMTMERGVIRFLYGRPLDTLLVTWGISLILIQAVRMVFGAQNVAVENPSWLKDGITVMAGIVFPFNRLATVGFSVLAVAIVWWIFQRTRLGLEVRAVSQNRGMAAAIGVKTAKVDMWTYGLGSGIAGLGGVILSQLGNVGPELGRSYILDSFMVVVLGGVGKIAGTVLGAIGLGLVNKFLEPSLGAVLAKISVLVFIILFIQKRPQGIFALKGRAVEA